MWLLQQRVLSPRHDPFPQIPVESHIQCGYSNGRNAVCGYHQGFRAGERYLRPTITA